jgi:hypothetical protein
MRNIRRNKEVKSKAISVAGRGGLMVFPVRYEHDIRITKVIPVNRPWRNRAVRCRRSRVV